MQKDPIPSRRAVPFKKVGSIHAGAGKITSIRAGSEYNDSPDDGLSEISIRHGAEPKPSESNQGPLGYHERKSSKVHIPHADAKKLKIGQRAKIHIEPL